MSVSVASSNASAFANDFTTSPNLTSVAAAVGDLIVAAWIFRSNDSGQITPAPTWNGESFTSRSDLVINDANTARLQVFSLKAASAGTFSILATNAAFKMHAGGYAVLPGSHATTPLGSIVSQSVWTWGSAPSLAVTDSVSGDLILEILGTLGWDDGFSDLSGTTWAPQNSQTELFELGNTQVPYPRIIFATKPGASGSQTLGYAPSAGQPGYAHAAFAVKQAGGGGSSMVQKMLAQH